MPYFEVQLTRKLQRIYDVTANTLIGRAPQCEIQLLSRAVSRRHARIEFDGREAIISDLGTKNGIKLNGQQVQGAAIVRDGDVLLVGDIKMVYRTANRTASTPGEAEAIDLRVRAPGPQDVEAALQPQATFVLPAHPTSLNQFQSIVARARIGALEDFDDVTRFKLQIALKEALDNARVHGCGGDPRRPIYVHFGEDQDEFVMSVKDEGPGYDVDRVLGGATEVDALEAIRSRSPQAGPLGLRIILNCVDRLQCSPDGRAIFLGKFKAGGQLLVISDDDVDGVPQGGGDAAWADPAASPFVPPDDDESTEGPLQLGDLFS
ncbi:MAG: FHA domain-containing protein [Planctomycetota bacterium]|nr:MAG: FHA domain-containing protein [Planctomycetota bacterium]